jgi:hypothetical protein
VSDLEDKVVKRLILAGMCVLVALVVGVACSASPGGALRRFDNGEILFEYPRDWESFAQIWADFKPGHDVELDADLVVGVADTGTATGWERFTTSVRVFRREMPADSSLEEVAEQAYQGMTIEEVISEGTTVVDNVTAYEWVYLKYHGEPLYRVREIWLEKGGRIYIVSCRTTPDAVEEAEEGFNAIIGSFHVK